MHLHQLKIMSKILKFSRINTVRNFVSVQKLKTISAPLAPSLAIWPFGYFNDEEQKTEPTEEKVETKDPSLWKLFSFDKFTFLSNDENKSKDDKKDKYWLGLFRREEKPWHEKMSEKEGYGIFEGIFVTTFFLVVFPILISYTVYEQFRPECVNWQDKDIIYKFITSLYVAAFGCLFVLINFLYLFYCIATGKK